MSKENTIYCKEQGINCVQHCGSESGKEQIEEKEEEMCPSMDQKYIVDLDLLHILNPGDLERRYFIYYDICCLLSNYLLSKRNKRNIKPLSKMIHLDLFSI